jgi:hypothetical protein
MKTADNKSLDQTAWLIYSVLVVSPAASQFKRYLAMMVKELDKQGASIYAKLDAGEALTSNELHIIWRIVQASENRVIAFLKVCGVVMISLLLGIFAVKYLFGFFDEEINATLFLICCFFGTITFYFIGHRHDNHRLSIERRLKCPSCSNKIAGVKIRELAESSLCPFCSKPWPLSASTDEP